MYYHKIKSHYVTAGALGFMSKKEMQDKLPELFKGYVSVYGNKHPDIKIISSEHFNFPNEQYEGGSWHIVFAFLNGEAKSVPMEQNYGKEQKLLPDSMILDCMTGNLDFCRLYVHPQNAAPLIKGDVELTDEEKIALSCMSGLKPFAREEEYFRIKYKNDWKAQSQHPSEYKDAVKSLANKGLVKLNKAGASQLTLEGKNKALHVGDVVRKYRGY